MTKQISTHPTLIKRLLSSSFHNHRHPISLITILMGNAGLSLMLSSCTGQLPGSFRYLQEEETYPTIREINTEIDILFVIDNSASMDTAQNKLRNGFASFARTYLQPTWDIQLAVITTDTYLANPAFSTYLSTTIRNSAGYKSNYIASRLSTWQNPTSNPSLVNTTTGYFDAGLTYNELVPSWGSDYARLLPGIHDGPTTSLCFEVMPYFYRGVTQCAVRDAATANTGISHCVTPDTAIGESSISQCVNTTQNNTVRSGSAILKTIPDDGTPADSAWLETLIQQFTVNATTGSVGHGSERGLSSLTQFITDNESSDTVFFRKGATRLIVFVSDEDDQSINIPDSPAADFTPNSNYKCDLEGLRTGNTVSRYTTTNGYCCADGSCTFGAVGTTCDSKTVDGYTYTVGVCPLTEELIPVATIQSQVSDFFKALDETDDANMVVASIVPTTAATIQAMQTERTASDTTANSVKVTAVDRGDRYIEFGTLTGSDSMTLDIGEEDYSPILDQIGLAIIAKKGSFTLDREPTSSEDMIITLRHADGTSTEITSADYTIDGKTIVVTNTATILAFAKDDQLIISYQPRTAY